MAGEPYSDFAVPGPSYGSKLSDEASMFFISLVEHFPALWDMTMSEYANNALKGALWRQIADEMEDRYPECGPYVPGTYYDYNVLHFLFRPSMQKTFGQYSRHPVHLFL